MSTIQIFMILGTLIAFAALGFGMHVSIKKHDARPKGKSKKGRMKYMQESRKPGR